jgi:HNH endonuclease
MTDLAFDIDHCFPWMAWPCDDLWNLLPAHRSTNQHEKSAKLPSAGRLGRAREQIIDWWNDAYFSSANMEISNRFSTEAQVSLPTVSSSPKLPDVFEGVELQRLRIHYDQ